MSRYDRRLSKWKKIKSKGLLSYIIKASILYYGVTIFLIWVILVPFIDSQFTLDFIQKDTFKIRVLIFGIISPLLGILMSYIWWKGYEKEFE